MELKDLDVVGRYLFEATRYMEYEKAEEAKEDLLALLKENLGEGPVTEERVKAALNRMGNPYTLGKHYETQGNFLISGRFYTLYLALLRAAGGGILLGTLFSALGPIPFLLSQADMGRGILEPLFSHLLLTFFATTLGFMIAERIKTKRILKKVLRPWTTEDLDEDPVEARLSRGKFFFIAAYAGVFGKILTDYYEYGTLRRFGYVHYLPALAYFFWLFRDALGICHHRRTKRFLKLVLILDVLGGLLLLGFLFYLKGAGSVEVILLWILGTIDGVRVIGRFRALKE